MTGYPNQKTQRVFWRAFALLLATVFIATSFADTTPELTDLSKLDPFKEAFTKEKGKVRLIALLSPT